MSDTMRAVLYGASSLLDITGSRGRSMIKNISEIYIDNGMKTDKSNIADDFNKAIKSIKK